jgi:hypothetical protein
MSVLNLFTDPAHFLDDNMQTCKKKMQKEKIEDRKKTPFTTNFKFYKSAIYPGYNPVDQL